MHAVFTRFEAYLLTEKRVAHHTYDAYRRDLTQFISYLQAANITLEDAEVPHLKAFLGYLKERGMSARTLARKISSLKVFYTYAHSTLGWRNRAVDLIFPKLEKRLPRYLTEDEINRLLVLAEKNCSPNGVRNRVMLCLLYVLGARISELTQLKVSDIHFDSHFIHVTGKGGKSRMVPVPASTLALLQTYLADAHKMLTQRKTKLYTTEFLFPTIYGKKVRPITRQAFWIILKDMCRQAGIQKNVSPHQLRHSLATHLLKNGADLRSLQLLLGHEQLTTVQVYTHVDTGFLRNMYDKKHPRS